jgi:probable rRNA maturation factor
MIPFIDIEFEYPEFESTLNTKQIELWIKAILDKLKLSDTSLSLLFSSNETIQSLNRQYLQNDYPTDVLSFSQLEGEPLDFLPHRFLGDIIISVPYVQQWALENNGIFQNEIHLLILHGILHLLGQDHENDTGEMIALQNVIFTELKEAGLG